MSDRRDSRSNNRRRAGRPPAGAKVGEKVKDYPQLSIRVPPGMKARLNAVSAVTGLAQWRVVAPKCKAKAHRGPIRVAVTGKRSEAASSRSSSEAFPLITPPPL